MSIVSFLKDYYAPEAGRVRTRDVIREMPGTIARGASAARRLFLPTQAEEFERMQQERQQSIFFTRDTALELQGRIGAPSVPYREGQLVQEYLKNPVIDPFGSMTARTQAVRLTKEAIVGLTKANSAQKVLGVLERFGVRFAKDVEQDAITMIAKSRNPGQIVSIVEEATTNPKAFRQSITQGLKTGARERGYVTSAKEVLTKSDSVAGQYIPRSTDKLSIRASNLIKDKPAVAVRMVDTAISTGRITDDVVAVASELIKKYGDDADALVKTDPAQADALYERAAQLVNQLAPTLTEMGRAIQAASILGRLTPEGQLRFAARQIQEWNAKYPGRAVPELTSQQAAYIRSEQKAINEMGDSIERSIRLQNLQNYMQDLVPTPLWKKMVAVWKAGLLTNPATQTLNFFSNMAHGLTEVVKQLPAAAVDSVAALFTGERTTTASMAAIREAFSGIKQGAIKGKRYFSTGFDERNIGQKIDYKRVNFGKGRVAKAFQKYTDTVFRALGAGDQPFYYAALSRSLMDQALAMGKNKGLKGKELLDYAYQIVDSPTEEMIRVGTADAATAVFINETWIGKLAAKVQSMPGMEFIIPFGRTPSAVGMQVIAYSPFGPLKTVIQQIARGQFNQREFSQAMGRGITGTAVLWIGMELAKRGLISEPYPKGDEKEQKLREAEGVKPDSIKIGDTWRSPLVLGPAGPLLIAGARFQRALDEVGSPGQAFAQATFGAGTSFLELPFLTGVQDFANALDDPKRYAASYLPNLIASFVPNIISSIARGIDPEQRRAVTTTERIKSRIPILRESLEPRINILGESVERGSNLIEIIFDPTRPLTGIEDGVTIEMRRLHNEGFRVSPTALGDKEGYDTLTAEQNTLLWATVGQMLNQKLTKLFLSPEYEALSDEQKAKTIERFVEYARTTGRATVALELTQGLQGEALNAKLLEFKGNLLNKESYRRYLELR